MIRQQTSDFTELQKLHAELEDTKLVNVYSEYIEESKRLTESVKKYIVNIPDETEEFFEQAAYDTALTIIAFSDDFFATLESVAEYVAPDYVITGEELNAYEKALNSFEETALGVKVDIVFDIVFDYLVDAIMEEFSLNELIESLKAYPIVDFGLDMVASLSPSCPSTPVIYPPPGDFLKSLSVDICDPTISLTLPQIVIPSIDWRYQIQSQFSEIFTQAIIKLVADIIVKIVSKSLGSLEGALCNLIEGTAKGLVDAINGDSFMDALNEAFCNDGESPETARKKAEELADALFSPVAFDSGADPTGAGAKVAGIIGSVASTNEVLGAMVSREGEENDQFNTRVSNAVNVLAPEMRSLLGSPNQVAIFFSNLGSYLSPDDRDRIRDLLEADLPNLPVYSAICLTDDQLEDWNNTRNQLLQDMGLTPEQAAERVADLNNKAEKALEDLMDTSADLDGDGPFEDALKEQLNKDVRNTDNPFNPTSEDPASQQITDQLTDAFYENITRSITSGMTGKNGIFGEALRDFDGRSDFSRKFLQFFNKNVQNSQKERNDVRAEKSFLGGIIMDAFTNEAGDVISQYPKTVGITQRDKILEDSGKSYDFSADQKNVIYRFADTVEDSDMSFTQDVAVTNNGGSAGNFNYSLSLQEKIHDQPYVEELSFPVPVSIDSSKSNFMESFGFQYTTNDSEDIRKSFSTLFVIT